MSSEAESGHSECTMFLSHYPKNLLLFIYIIDGKMKGDGKMKENSIRRKIMLRMSATILVATLLTGMIGAIMNYNSTMTLVEQTMLEAVKLAANCVEGELQAYSNIAYEVGCIHELSDEAVTVERKQQILNERVKTYGFERGNILDASGKSIFDGTDYSERDYFKTAIKGDTCISEPLISKVTGQLTVIISAPIWKDGIAGGTVEGVLYFVPVSTFLSDIVTDIQLSKGGSAYILSKSGTTIAHHDVTKVTNEENKIEDSKTDSSLKQIAVLEKKMVNGKNGFGKYTYEGTNKVLAYTSIAGTGGWSIAIDAPMSDFLSSVMLSILVTAVVLIITLVVSTFITRRLSVEIGNPLTACADRLKQLAEGDLHSPMPQTNSQDEIALLIEASTLMQNDLKDVISDIKYVLNEFASGNFAVKSKNRAYYKGDYQEIILAMQDLRDTMSAALEQINSAANQVDAGAEKIATASTELSHGTEEQASAVEELNATIETIIGISENSAKQTQEAYENISYAVKNAENGQMQMEQLQEEMRSIKTISNEIANIITTIEEIASQTSLLSLNASIEAARAGEAGRGFAVVAGEIGKLATNSAQAVVDTRDLIEKTIREIDKGNGITKTAVEAFESIIKDMEQFAELAKKTNEITQEQKVALEQVDVGIEQIAGVTQQNANASEETASLSDELAAQATELNMLVGHFQL